MSIPPKTMTRKVFNGTQLALSTLGLSGVVEGTIGLGDMAVSLLSHYLRFSEWILMQISTFLPYTPPELVFHYFLLGSPFWTPIFYTLTHLHSSIVKAEISGSFVWKQLIKPAPMVIAEYNVCNNTTEFYSPIHNNNRNRYLTWPEGRPSLSKVKRQWRELRKLNFWQWMKLTATVTLFKISLVSFTVSLVAALIISPMLIVMAWPFFLMQAIAARRRRTNTIKRSHALSPLLSRALDRFTLVLFIFVIFISVSAGLERNGGHEIIMKRFTDNIEKATK